MKQLLIIGLLLFISTLLTGQVVDTFYKTTQRLNNLAYKNYQTKKYKEAAETYENLMQLIKNRRYFDKSRYVYKQYDAADAWAMAGETSRALANLDSLVSNYEYTDVDQLKEESAFKSLHTDPKWNIILQKAETNRLTKKEIDQYYRVNYDLILPREDYGKLHTQIDPKEIDMIPFREDYRFGFVSNTPDHTWLIKPQFTQVFAVYKEGAIVRDTVDEYGLIQSDGTYLIPSGYHNIFKKEGIYHAIKVIYATTTLKGKPLPFGHKSRYWDFVAYQNDYYNQQGKLLFSEQSSDFQSFRKGEKYAWFRFGNRVRIRNRKGKLLKTIYNSPEKILTCISNDLLVYVEKKGEKYSLVARTLNDKVAIKLPSYPNNFVRYFEKLNDTLYVTSDDEFYYRFVDENNKYLYDGIPDNINFLGQPTHYLEQEELTIRNMGNDSSAVINKKGEFIIDWVAQRNLPLSVNGLRYMGVDHKHKGSIFLNVKGDTLFIEGHGISFHDRKLYREYYLLGNMGFYENWTVTEGYHLRQDTTDEGEIQNMIDHTYLYYFDKNGEVKLCLPKEIQFAGHFSEGLAPALDKDNNLGFINKKGEWAIDPKYELALIGNYPMFSMVFPQFKGGLAYLEGFKGYIDKNGKLFFSGERMEDSYRRSH